MPYLQFCPIAKASELLSERWTFLIIRELLAGGKRFNDFQRGMSSISPTVLTKRLNVLNENGIIIKKKIQGQRGYEYYLTDMGKELAPILQSIGEWGMRWTRGQIADNELDIQLLMLYLERSINTDKLPDGETVISFTFNDLATHNKWWLVINDSEIDLCTLDPNKDIDIWLNTQLRDMVEIWMGDTSLKSAIRQDKLKLVGPAYLTNHVNQWLSLSDFADIPAAVEI